MPAERGIEAAADQRRDHRGDHHRHGHPADHRGGAVAVVEIADHGAADHDAGGRAEGLRRAGNDQSGDRRGGERRETCHHGQHQPRHHHRAAAEAVRQRPEHELRDRHAEQIERERELHRAGLGAEADDQAGHRGREDVERKRADRRDRDQQREQPVGVTGGVVVRSRRPHRKRPFKVTTPSTSLAREASPLLGDDYDHLGGYPIIAIRRGDEARNSLKMKRSEARKQSILNSHQQSDLRTGIKCKTSPRNNDPLGYWKELLCIFATEFKIACDFRFVSGIGIEKNGIKGRARKLGVFPACLDNLDFGPSVLLAPFTRFPRDLCTCLDNRVFGGSTFLDLRRRKSQSKSDFQDRVAGTTRSLNHGSHQWSFPPLHDLLALDFNAIVRVCYDRAIQSVGRLPTRGARDVGADIGEVPVQAMRIVIKQLSNEISRKSRNRFRKSAKRQCQLCMENSLSIKSSTSVLVMRESYTATAKFRQPILSIIQTWQAVRPVRRS